MSSNSNRSRGLGLCSVLLIVFVVLKLTGNIDWSWVWVLSPLWIPIGIALSLVGIVGMGIVIAAMAAFLRR
jgi:ABC-type antimicrobial peptide transport system permease subunit